MKAGNSILDADMTTLVGWVRSGLGWWLDELRAMVPERWRGTGRGFASHVTWRGPGEWERAGKGDAPVVLVDPALCLLRQITLPPLGDADLQRLVALDADRIMPIPSAQLVVAASADPRDRGQVAVAGMPRATAQAMLDDLAAAGIVPARVGLADPSAPGRMGIELTHPLSATGLLAAKGRVASGWWAVVAFLFAINLGLLVWRDAQEVAQLETLVSGQAPAVMAARKPGAIR